MHKGVYMKVCVCVRLRVCACMCALCLHTFVPTPKEQVPLLQSTRSSSLSGFFCPGCMCTFGHRSALGKVGLAC